MQRKIKKKCHEKHCWQHFGIFLALQIAQRFRKTYLITTDFTNKARTAQARAIHRKIAHTNLARRATVQRPNNEQLIIALHRRDKLDPIRFINSNIGDRIS